MTKLKKITALLGITALSATMVFGCGNKADETTAATTEAATEATSEAATEATSGAATEAASEAGSEADGADAAAHNFTEDSKYLEWKLADWEAASEEEKMDCAFTYGIAAANVVGGDVTAEDLTATAPEQIESLMQAVEASLQAAPEMTIQEMLDATVDALEQLETMEVTSESAE